MSFKLKITNCPDISEIKNKKMAIRIFRKLHTKKYPDKPDYQLIELKRLQAFFNAKDNDKNLNPKTIDIIKHNKADINLMIEDYEFIKEGLIKEEEIDDFNQKISQFSTHLQLGVIAITIGAVFSFVMEGFLKLITTGLVLVSLFKIHIDLFLRKFLSDLLSNKVHKKIEFLHGGWAKENYKLMKLLNEFKE
ncbi:MAG: hypothetical protein WC356_03100 [Candidatus Micrarchaeia archaeon]|jgi:hypothetical protein